MGEVGGVRKMGIRRGQEIMGGWKGIGRVLK